MSMSKPYTRREFLKTAALGAMAVGVVGYLGGRRSREITCAKCGAIFRDGHEYKEGKVEGVYCPNCGVELSRLVFDVDQRARFPYSRVRSKRKGGKSLLNYAQVPFPNRKLMGATDKPVAVFSEVNFEGRRTI